MAFSNNVNHEIIDKARNLAENKFKKRALTYDDESIFPKENLIDLHKENLLSLLISENYGGQGLGHSKKDILTQWLVTKEFAKADMAFARIWEGHSNAVLLIDNIANKYQKEKWFAGIQNEGHIWACWSGEPQSKKPGVTRSFGTQVIESADGYRISGSKIFCSGAPGVDYAILFVSTSGPGGARHSDGGEDLIMLACDMSTHGISIDDSWWNPIGMKASVSHLVNFENVFIPKENLIGIPGQYISQNWQTRLTPQYASCFLGGAESAYDYTLEYIKKQNRQSDPYIHLRLAKMNMGIETSHLWLAKTAQLWTSSNYEHAIQSGNSTRYLIEKLAIEIVQHGLHICGARALIKPSPLEKIFRDLSFYVRHDNNDQILSSIGKSLLNQTFDGSFFRSDNAVHVNNSKNEQ